MSSHAFFAFPEEIAYDEESVTVAAGTTGTGAREADLLLGGLAAESSDYE
jgi:hypothetical protein